jgi:HD-GYP domain-containing protein (c-di-GMP phosphodiesterase class II)
VRLLSRIDPGGLIVNDRRVNGETRPAAESVRRLEILATLSLAIDLGSGQPSGHGLRATALANHLAAQLALSDEDRRDAVDLTLLRFIGCTTDSHLAAAVFGDEIAAASFLVGSDYGSALDVIGRLARDLAKTEALPRRARRLIRAIAGMPKLKETSRSHCEVGAVLLEQLGFEERVRDRYRQMFERWDGRGQPRGLRGDAVPAAVWIAQAAHDAIALHRMGGLPLVRDAGRRRRGGAWAPTVADVIAQVPDAHFAAVDEQPWEEVLRSEGEPHRMLTGLELDRALEAMADFADYKSLFHAGHTRGVSALCERAARIAGMNEAAVTELRRAALLHDLGRAGISAALWNHAGPLTAANWERVRLHSYYTERCLAHSTALKPLASIAACHHERLDSSGYHRAMGGAQLPRAARILQAADVLHALREPRAYRPPHSTVAAETILMEEAQSGRLGRDEVEMVLAAAGSSARPPSRPSADLSPREREVLQLLAVGRTTREVGELLGISAKTADRHIQNLYAKLGVSTRAAATCFAVELGLVDPFRSSSS